MDGQASRTSPPLRGRQIKLKYKCFKSDCPVCHQTGSIQLFLNKKYEVRYARTRHSYLAKDSKKQQFTYCKIENLEVLKTLLSKQLNSLALGTSLGQVGQVLGFVNLDPQLRGCATKLENRVWAVSSARIEHQPPKLGVEGSNPSPPATICQIEPKLVSFTPKFTPTETIDFWDNFKLFLEKDYRGDWKNQIFRNAKKYSPYLLRGDLSILKTLTDGQRLNAMKARSAYSKFAGCYERYKQLIKIIWSQMVSQQ